MSPDTDSVAFVLNLLRTAIGESFEERNITYYDGDPGVIPHINLPAIVVELLRDDDTKASRSENDLTDSLVVKVIFNKKDDYTGEKVDPLNLTHRKIRRTIGARDETTKRYYPNTVKGVLTEGLGGDRRIGKAMSTEYGVVERKDGLETAEGHVTFQLLQSFNVN